MIFFLCLVSSCWGLVVFNGLLALLFSLFFLTWQVLTPRISPQLCGKFKKKGGKIKWRRGKGDTSAIALNHGAYAILTMPVTRKSLQNITLQ